MFRVFLGVLAGALMGPWTGTISTSTFGIDLVIGLFLMLLLGGIGSMWGPVVGAAVYVALPEVVSGLEEHSTIAYGVLLLITIMVLLDGVVGGLGRLRYRIEGRFRRGRPSTGAGPRRGSVEAVDAVG